MAIRQFHGTTFVSLATALFLVLAILCIAAFPSDAHGAVTYNKNRPYGSLSSWYETNDDPAEIDYNSSGLGEAYGAYQMGIGNAYNFSKWLSEGADKPTSNKNRSTYITWGKNLLTAHESDGDKCGKKFDKAWKAICSSSTKNKGLFSTLQYQYCVIHYYNTANNYWKSKLSGFDAENYSTAFKSVLFSTAIQHGPWGSYDYIGSLALEAIGGWQKGLAEDVLINAIYDERSKLKSGTKELAHFHGYYIDSNAGGYGIYQRLHVNERADALALMTKFGAVCSHSSTTGGTNSYSTVSETKHKVYTSALACKSCGAVLKAATSKTVSHSFKHSGKSHKCACGQSYIVHDTKKYYRVKTALNLRASASTSSSVKITIPKGKVFKSISYKKGSDGNWWLKVKYNGKTGYVRAYYMEIHGTGSSWHVHSNGKCKYCKTSKSVLSKNKVAGMYKASKSLTTYTAAYTASTKKDTVASGSTVTITKVVKNRYNNLWGKTSQGTYVDMKNLKRV